MSNNPYNLATPLADNPYFTAFIRVVREELERIDPEKLLVYLFDTVDASLLDTLAEQFDMLGYNGWILATTETQKRELLKDSARLHDLQGHPAGIKEVALRLGFKDVIIEENTGAPEDAANPWAYFKVKYVLADDRVIDTITPVHLGNMIDVYKGMRNILADLSLVIQRQDSVAANGLVTVRVLDATTNALISETVTPNVITSSGLFWIAKSIGAAPTGGTGLGERVNRIRFSSHSGPHTVSQVLSNIAIILDKDLDEGPEETVSEANGRNQVYVTGSEVYVRHWFSLAAGEGNGNTVRTLGLISQDVAEEEADALFAVMVRAGIAKTSAIKLEGTWDIYFRNQV